MNLLEGYKAEISGAMKNIFDSFSRSAPFFFYKPALEEVVIFNDSFNSDLQEGVNNPNVILTEQVASFRCRIIYPSRERTFDNFVAGGSNILVKGEADLGLINLQFEADALEYLKDCIRFTFMGEKYQKHSSIRQIGVLDTFNVWQITLKRVN